MENISDIQHKNFLNLNFLKSLNIQPRSFGLGFIQLKLNQNERLHFWHPELLQNTPEEELHDHRYDFTSTILKGYLNHEIWIGQKNDQGSHKLVEVSCSPEKENPPTTLYNVDLKLITSATFKEGSQYFIEKDQFHKTISAKGVTYLKRKSVEKEYARVIKPHNGTDICPFAVKLSEDECWNVIADILEQENTNELPGYHINPITKGKLGEISKIQEEIDELKDAAQQDAKIMELIELSDLIGAIELYLEKRHPATSFEDLQKMKDITKRAFINGHRS